MIFFNMKKKFPKSYPSLCAKISVTISDFISFQSYVRLHGFPHAFPEITGGICTALTQFYLIFDWSSFYYFPQPFSVLKLEHY